MFKGEFKKEFVLDLFNIFKSINAKIEELTFRFSSVGLRIHGMNDSKCLAFIGDFEKDDIFNSYDSKGIDKEDVFNMKTDLLKNVLNRLKTENLNIDYNNADLVLSNIKGKFTLPVLITEETDKKFVPPTLLYNTEFNINVPLFFEKFESGNIININEFVIEMKDELLTISGGGEGRTQKFSCTFPSEDIIIEEGKASDAMAKFSYNFLSFMKLPFDIVEVKINSDYPMKLEYKYEGNSNIVMFLAPVVRN